MSPTTSWLARRARTVAAVVAVILSSAVGVTAGQRSTAAQLRDVRVPAQVPQGFVGGEVVLEVTVDSRGTVAEIKRVRVTPPYSDAVVDSVSGWRFAPATAAADRAAVGASVLVVAVFRPPVFYAGPAPGGPPQVVGLLSPRVPGIESVSLPPYPPRAVGDAIVVVEIAISNDAKPRGYRIVGPASGFDAAALAAVRSWKFSAPRAPDGADPVFAYALVGFRAPLTPLTKPPR